MLVSASTVFVAVPFLAVRTAVLMGLPFGASARVDVGEVERVGFGEIAQLELYDRPSEVSSKEAVPLTPEWCSGCRVSFTLALW